ncbi:RimK/LysX family protein [Lutimaribacter sp. EGI FJ00015]|uniref:RimK/LysX family protein n=1 Tax=Lutimaribacter degradans TaxID=2945989 RepID=A0ACC5ZUJ4_9RHOB|nr:RimK/LysX family protein [Lutimaribacter sp. EGI FJ00013]MCM2561795.1 RimK/LysX family protein [Lutimaribacter sp. EGI FJ00013]MCO0613172.1 RimK/LysX family protein [Lutimaribacter sp. EGI FJ00015]MCO0635628.1 RimK/LysX family protein [Lutimaribacter sp. EGI FJ00014]
MTTTRRSTKKPSTIIGWREKIALPDLGIPLVHAKIDTGARTSAIHATHIRPFEKDGRQWVKFHIPHASGLRARDVTAPLLGERAVKNTSGDPQDRLVIETLMILGGRRWHIEVTLADRANMTMPIILGRTAIRRRRILVDAGRSFLVGAPVIETNSQSAMGQTEVSQ